MSRSRKAPKDTNAPKKAQTAYFLFANKRRPLLQEAHKDKKITEIAKLVGAEWKLLSEEERKGYMDESAKLRAEYKLAFEAYQKTDNFLVYQKQLAEWKLNNPGKGKKSGKGGAFKLPKRPKDTKAPKRNMSAYFHFSNKRRPVLREENKDKKVTQIAKMIGEEWKVLGEEARKPFVEAATAEKKAYEEALAKYKLTDDFANHLKVLNEWKKKCQEMKKKQQQMVKEAKHKQSRTSRKHGKHGKKSRRDSYSSSDSDSDSDSSSSSSSSDSTSSSSDSDSD